MRAHVTKTSAHDFSGKSNEWFLLHVITSKNDREQTWIVEFLSSVLAVRNVLVSGSRKLQKGMQLGPKLIRNIEQLSQKTVQNL